MVPPSRQAPILSERDSISIIATSIKLGSSHVTSEPYHECVQWSAHANQRRFGFGLSYSTFDYSVLKSTYSDQSAGDQTPIPGGTQGLFDTVATVTALITNNGSVAAAEVAQLYIGLPSSNTPSKQLRGFEKILLQPGASQTVTFNLRRKDLSVWNTNSQKWSVPSGTIQVYVGSSSRDIRLSGTMGSSGSTGGGTTTTSTATTSTTSRTTSTSTTSRNTSTTTTVTLPPNTTTTKPTTTTLQTSTKTTTTTACATKYGQCGGRDWQGPTCCTSSTLR